MKSFYEFYVELIIVIYVGNSDAGMQCRGGFRKFAGRRHAIVKVNVNQAEGLWGTALHVDEGYIFILA